MKSHVFDGVDLVEAAVLAEARMRGDEYLKASGSGLIEGQPGRRFAKRAVEVDERCSLTGVPEHRRPAGHHDGLGLASAPRQQHTSTVFQFLDAFQHAWSSRCVAHLTRSTPRLQS